jgi:hypothetical protein
VPTIRSVCARIARAGFLASRLHAARSGNIIDSPPPVVLKDALMRLTFRQLAITMNVIWLMGIVARFVISDSETKLADISYAVLLILNFTVPPISIAALLTCRTGANHNT